MLEKYNDEKIVFEKPIFVQNIVVSSAGQSRPLLTNLSIHEATETSIKHDGKLHIYRSYRATTSEGMGVIAYVETFRNTQWHEMEWTPIPGTRLDKFNIFDFSMKYEGHY